MSKKKEFEKRKKFILELLSDPLYQPMRFREIASLLRLDKEQKKDLFEVLEQLVWEGKADLDSKGRYSKASGKKNKNKNTPAYEGIFIGHPKGFGFVEVEGEDEDIFIPEEDTGTAMHQDRVRVIIRKDQQDG